MAMLAKDKIGDLEKTGRGDMENRLNVVGAGKGTTSWWIRGMPIGVRDVAEAVAKEQGMTLSDFLAEAILEHAGRLETAIDTVTSIDNCIAGALQEYVSRIEALENRLATVEAAGRRGPKLKAHKLVRNLVERPWLKNPEPMQLNKR